MIDRIRCPVFGFTKPYPCIIVDAATEAEYAMAADDLPTLKTFIWHDGTRPGRNQAEALARSLEESGVAVRDLSLPGVVKILEGDRHRIIERRHLGLCHD